MYRLWVNFGWPSWCNIGLILKGFCDQLLAWEPSASAFDSLKAAPSGGSD